MSDDVHDKVVSSTIAQDLEEINTKVKNSSLALRRERVRMIKVGKLVKSTQDSSFLLDEG